MKKVININLSEDQLSKINGGSEVPVRSDTGEDIIFYPQNTSVHPHYGSDNKPPAHNEDIWNRG